MSIRPAPWSAHTFSAHLVAALVTAFGLAQPASAQAPASQSLPGTAAPAETTFRLNDVRLKGVAALDEQELHQLAAPYLGRDVNLAELQALAQAITAQYREHGYFLAQAIVPVQQVKDGVVEISVIEGRLGQVNVTVAPDAPITAERVRAFLAAVPV